VHGGAVTLLALPLAGTASVVAAPEELEPPLALELEPPPDDPPLPELWVQGGTMSVDTPLLLGSTSWFCGDWLCPPELDEEPPDEEPPDEDPPPGVTRMVLEGGGMLEPPDDEPPDEEELPPPLELWAPQGWTATVWVRAPVGTTSWLDPGGVVLAPGWTVWATEQGGTTTRRSLRCLDTTIVRTPGVWRAFATGSCCELDDLPHA
jgi:hypothetical protein